MGELVHAAAHRPTGPAERDLSGASWRAGTRSTSTVSRLLADDALLTMPPVPSYLRGYGVLVFSLRDGAIAGIVGFADAATFDAFGLPLELAPEPAGSQSVTGPSRTAGR